MQSSDLPESYVWRGIELKRVMTKEYRESGYGFGTGRAIERLSDPPHFSGTVGIWRYTVEQQADGSWLARIWIGGASNATTPTYSTPLLALDYAAAWWRAAVDGMPSYLADTAEAGAEAI